MVLARLGGTVPALVRHRPLHLNRTGVRNTHLCQRQRAVLGTSGVTHFLHDGFSDVIYLLLPIWQAELGLSLAQTGVLKSCYSGALATCQVPAGLLAERDRGDLTRPEREETLEELRREIKGRDLVEVVPKTLAVTDEDVPISRTIVSTAVKERAVVTTHDDPLVSLELVEATIRAAGVDDAVLAVPALAREIELALGVAVGISLGCYRIVVGDPIHWYIMAGYVVVVLQTLVAEVYGETRSDREHLARDCRAERVSAEGRAMVARLENFTGFFIGQAGPDRHAITQRFCQCHYIWFDTVMLEGEPFAGAAHASLYFVQH